MKPAITKFVLAAVVLAIGARAQNTSPVQGDAGQSSQPPAVTDSAPATTAPPAKNTTWDVHSKSQSKPGAQTDTADDNPYNPVLEPPALPKGKPTLIGGIATSVDQVRNRLTIAPFGGGKKVKLFTDERSHIYRNGTETTVLGIHKGDRVYADTMLDGSKIFAKNVRVVTEVGVAEVRGQVLAVNPANGTIRVDDQLSARPVTFSVSNATKYSATKGSAGAGDVKPGSLVDVQFAPEHSDRDLAQEITILAKAGDDYIFSGVVTNLDMRSDTLALENRSDQQTYELHFDRAAMGDAHALKVGAEVTAHAVFDGKQYKTSNIRVESTKPEASEQSKAQ